MEGLKSCTTCKKARPLASFHKDSRSKDGRRSRCSACVSARAKLDSKRPPVIDGGVTHLICPRCVSAGRDGRLPLSDFGLARRRRSGKNSWCRQCCSEATCEWQRTDGGRKKHIEAVKRYNAKKRRERLGVSS